MGKPRFELESNASKAPMLTPTPFPQFYVIIIFFSFERSFCFNFILNEGLLFSFKYLWKILLFSSLCRENRTPTPGSTAPCTTIILYRAIILIQFWIIQFISINLEEYILWSYFNGFNGGKIWSFEKLA